MDRQTDDNYASSSTVTANNVDIHRDDTERYIEAIFRYICPSLSTHLLLLMLVAANGVFLQATVSYTQTMVT